MNGLFHEPESNDVNNGHDNDIEEAENTCKTGKDEVKEVQSMEEGDKNEKIDKNAVSAKSGKKNEDISGKEEILLNDEEYNYNSKEESLGNEEDNDNDDSDALGITCDKDADISGKVSEENVNTESSNTNDSINKLSFNSAEISELMKDKTDDDNLGKEDADFNRNDRTEDKKSVMEENVFQISKEDQQDMECDNSAEKVDEKNMDKINPEKQSNKDEIAEIDKFNSEKKSDEAEIAEEIEENEKMVASTEVVKPSEESTQIDLKSLVLFKYFSKQFQIKYALST